MIRTKEGRKIREHTNPEQWFVEQLRSYTQRQPRGPRTDDCPDDAFLRAYAARPGSFSLSDPRLQHVTSCDHCLPALLDFRSIAASRRPVAARAAIAVLCAACLIVGFLIAKYWTRQNSIASNPAFGQRASAAVDRTLDLTNYATLRGAEEQPPKPPLNLPAALLHVNLILPRFSEAGPYTIIVVAGREGTNRIAYATGNASIVGNQTKLTVTLDLRRARPGSYVLLTELSGQEDWYSYPLRIQ
ncbi:MAG TPA: hypothetical protein VJT08_07525 [Terriglobales bacterium]|nr:hypothetical protein [Acidobacteriaceae bacterium]HKR30310.1 hypothetical protein [Terriglobales bacterium]